MTGTDAAGVPPSAACCGMMLTQLMQEQCPDHHDRCPDVIIRRSHRLFEPDGLVIPIYDGGESGITIRYCPWCGTALTGEATPEWV